MTITAERKSFQTAAQLIAALESFAGVLKLDEMYVTDCDGNELDQVELMQETLSDGSMAFNVIVSTQGDPNS
jgi:hypothetical protein